MVLPFKYFAIPVSACEDKQIAKDFGRLKAKLKRDQAKKNVKRDCRE
jgi:hypothetical protein